MGEEFLVGLLCGAALVLMLALVSALLYLAKEGGQ